MQKNILQIIEKYCREKKLIHPGDGIVVGLSGGADSVFLLWVLSQLKEKWKLRLQAVHVNHGIREAEAEADEAFARQWAEQNGIPCQIYREDIPALARREKMTEEEAGRFFRYQCFAREREKMGYNSVAVAHHRDDQAETILFQMMRGSALRGMGGMRPVGNGIIRPLLCVSRAEIEGVLMEQKIPYCTDSTNSELSYSRNRLRKQVMPVLQEIQNGAGEHIAATGEYLQELMDYVDMQRDSLYESMVEENKGERRILLQDIQKVPAVLQREIIIRMVEETAGKKKDITAAHIRSLQNLLTAGTGKGVDLPYHVRGYRDYDGLVICRKEDNISHEESDFCREICWEEPITVPIGMGENISLSFQREEGESFRKRNLKKYCTKCFDYDKMVTMPIFRYAQPGDYFWLDRTGRTKKLSRYFIDRKVPRDRRGHILVLAEGHHVLWIPEYDRCSAYYYLSETTKQVMKVERLDQREQNQERAWAEELQKEKGGHHEGNIT